MEATPRRPAPRERFRIMVSATSSAVCPVATTPSRPATSRASRYLASRARSCRLAASPRATGLPPPPPPAPPPRESVPRVARPLLQVGRVPEVQGSHLAPDAEPLAERQHEARV